MRRHGRKPHTERLFCAGILCAFSLLALAGCASSEVPAERPVRIVLEENESFSSDRFVFDLMAGESVSAKLTPHHTSSAAPAIQAAIISAFVLFVF